MKSFLSLLFLLSAAVLLTGCPYESEVPIDTPSVKYPAGLLGKWEPKSSSDNLMIITKKSDFIFHIVKTKKEAKADDTPEEYDAYMSDVGGLKFLNLTESKQDEWSTKKYYLYKMELATSGARLTLSPVTENIREKFTDSKELKAFIQKHMHLSFFYDKEDEVYIRAD
ncbi:MAG TPA: hypothetical protein PKE63_00650 [Lacibacter sp.]|nr:hypothetical protein [Lacibacter sp.]HMO88339.1 hypothetical protein [Lacibacter sp.]HMP85751.1 hypothetical protein [Lacibacter sp.]